MGTPGELPAPPDTNICPPLLLPSLVNAAAATAAPQPGHDAVAADPASPALRRRSAFTSTPSPGSRHDQPLLLYAGARAAAAPRPAGGRRRRARVDRHGAARRPGGRSARLPAALVHLSVQLAQDLRGRPGRRASRPRSTRRISSTPRRAPSPGISKTCPTCRSSASRSAARRAPTSAAFGRGQAKPACPTRTSCSRNRGAAPTPLNKACSPARPRVAPPPRASREQQTSDSGRPAST